jgi:3-hydroxyacyl-[acyl-carrier-protein] dehydratase
VTAVLEFADIRRVLPHRYPILLLDRVVALEPGVQLTALKAVSGNESCFRDAPDDGYPPMLLVESWCQAAGVLAAWRPGSGGPRPILLGALAGIRFIGRVQPGHLVEHRVRLERSVGDTSILSGQSLVDGEAVLRVGHVIAVTT